MRMGHRSKFPVKNKCSVHVLFPIRAFSPYFYFRYFAHATFTRNFNSLSWHLFLAISCAGYEKGHFVVPFWCDFECADGRLTVSDWIKCCWKALKRTRNTRTIYDLISRLNWLLIVIFSFLTKLAIMFHTNSYILPLNRSAREPGCPVQQPRGYRWTSDLSPVVFMTRPSQEHEAWLQQTVMGREKDLAQRFDSWNNFSTLSPIPFSCFLTTHHTSRSSAARVMKRTGYEPGLPWQWKTRRTKNQKPLNSES